MRLRRATPAEILAAANRASALTRQLLAFGRRQVLHPTRVDLNEPCNRWRAMLRQLIGENIDLRIICARDIPADPRGPEPARIALANLGDQCAGRHAARRPSDDRDVRSGAGRGLLRERTWA